MAISSGISWTRSTFNPWIGCTKIGPGCDNCYAEQLDKRMHYAGAEHWGDGVPRYRTSQSNWNNALRWNRMASVERESGIVLVQDKKTWHTPGFWPVFCASLADVFDNQVTQQWRDDLWELIEATPNLSWLLVTKRIGNVKRMAPARWLAGYFPPQVRLLITVCDQEEADRDIPKLFELPVNNGISYEPALGPIDWAPYLDRGTEHMGHYEFPGLQWIIVGGESTQGNQARIFDIHWARSTIKQCKAAGVAVFVKQLGSNPMGFGPTFVPHIHHRAGGDMTEWPEDLRIQEFPK